MEIKIEKPHLLVLAILVFVAAALSVIQLTIASPAVPGVFHSPDEITPGSFQSGTYSFPGSVGVGTMPGEKLDVVGNIKSSGNLWLGAASNWLFDGAKIRRALLPFEQGDITSDVDSNTWDAGYYNVANLGPGNVGQGVAFGRGQTGTLESLQTSDIAAVGMVIQAWSRAQCYVECFNPWRYYFIDLPVWWTRFDYDPRNILGTVVAATTTCLTWSGGNCFEQTYTTAYAFQCDSRSGWVTDNWHPVASSLAGECTNSLQCHLWPYSCLAAVCHK